MIAIENYVHVINVAYRAAIRHQWHSLPADKLILLKTLHSIQLLSVLRKHLIIGQFSYSLFFIGHRLPEWT